MPATARQLSSTGKDYARKSLPGHADTKLKQLAMDAARLSEDLWKLLGDRQAVVASSNAENAISALSQLNEVTLRALNMLKQRSRR
jgi:hypothetical protein